MATLRNHRVVFSVLATILILAACDVASAVELAGGTIGQNNGLAHDCYAIVDVQGDGIIGGLVGVNTGAVRFCFAAGAPYGSGWVGGLAGRNPSGTIVYSYWDWDFEKTWTICEGRDYPRLQWEEIRCNE